MWELTDNLLEEIAKRLAEAIHPERIYHFGLHTPGNVDRHSDVDLPAVVPNTGIMKDAFCLGEDCVWVLKRSSRISDADRPVEATPWASR